LGGGQGIPPLSLTSPGIRDENPLPVFDRKGKRKVNITKEN